jgi:hypothetical protein
MCDCFDIGWCLRTFVSIRVGADRVRTHTCIGIRGTIRTRFESFGLGEYWELVFECDCFDIGWCLKALMSLQGGVDRLRTHTCTGIRETKGTT